MKLKHNYALYLRLDVKCHLPVCVLWVLSPDIDHVRLTTNKSGYRPTLVQEYTIVLWYIAVNQGMVRQRFRLDLPRVKAASAPDQMSLYCREQVLARRLAAGAWRERACFEPFV